MKRYPRLILIAVLTIILVGVLAGGVVAITGDRASGRASQNGLAAPAETAPVVQGDRAVMAKGAVVPINHAQLGMAAGGIVSEVLVKEGDPVAAGQVILRLQNGQQQAALAEAEAAVASAQAELDTLKAGARTQEVTAAQAAAEAANARLARLKEAGRTGDVAAARAAVDAAQAALKRLYDGPDENDRIAAAADVANATAAVRNAQAAYDEVKGQSNIGMLPQSLQLEQATNNLNAAQARYEELTAPPKADRVAQATAEVKQAQANLDKLLVPATASEIAEAEAQARQAQAQLDLLLAGARQQQIAAAQAAVAQAEAARQQAQASLDDTELHAPFAGTLAVLNVRPGEPVAAGSPVAEIGDLSAWQVETDDLSELDIVRVQPGQNVALTFDAIPDLRLQGTVERIQAKGEKKLGDMTYTATIRITEPDPRLLWNMTAVVNLP